MNNWRTTERKKIFSVNVVAMTKINVVNGHQEISLECNNFNHENNNNFLLEGDGHHKNDIVKIVIVHKIN